MRETGKAAAILTSIIISVVFMPQEACLAQPPGKYIRVAIAQDAVSLNLKVPGYYEIVDPAAGRTLSSGYGLKTTATTQKNGILLGKAIPSLPRLFIKTDGTGVILVNGRRFRGSIELIKKDDARILAVNYIDLENYIKGILYHEVSHYWPMEALAAQAIVSRTYAAYQMQENKSKDYDVTSDIYSQVYGGRTSERSRTTEAVDATSGRILTYKDKIIPAYFHAVCGGHTEDASLLWNIDMPPLKGLPCNFCKDSPRFNWHYVLALEDIEDSLAGAGLKINGIKNIVVSGRDKSGRVTDLNMVSAKKDLKISAKDFRNIVGPNIIKSANFTVSVIKNDAVFEGVGWGHGVGLCQWGAYFMSKQGYRADEILKYYYPGTDVKVIRF
ncbi:MAG: SpoIID/LytB domain-containing protein [Candidatus Omnitrophota bacterium]